MQYHCLKLLALCLLLTASSAAPAADPPGSPARIGVGLYGSNGHQLPVAELLKHPNARLVAVAMVKGEIPPEAGVHQYATLDALLADPAVEIVSLCSPRRSDQARDAIKCLAAGKHVYAEKPCALTERELDEVLAAAGKAGREFHEMAGTVFVQPYLEMRRIVRAGEIGEVIQVLVQKSYPYGTHRPQDEGIDGGLFLQAGIHAARMVEHAGGVRMRSIVGIETAVGLPETGECKTAAAAQIGLENGGIATLIMNYLNPAHLKPRNHETLRIFGTKGFVESTDGGSRTRLVTLTGVVEPLNTSAPGTDYFDFVAKHLTSGAAMPLTSEEELHPLRMLLRAKEKMRAEAAGGGKR
jgi:predicted dehydrogenase